MSLAWFQFADSGSFSVNARKNSFHRFRCGAAGNQLKLWAANHLPIYEAAIDLCQHLSLPVPQRNQRAIRDRTEKRNQ
jgi:DNA primase